ncbi:MAG TPA: hypothetical protein VFZ03_03445 [Dongiaceae bacterium]
MTAERLLSKMRRQAWRDRNRWRWKRKRSGDNIVGAPWTPKSDPAARKQFDAADQLRIVMGADFMIQPLLNKSEARVFKELDRMVIGCNPGWQVMAQVSLGEILRSKDADAYGCINSKRVDLLAGRIIGAPRRRAMRSRRRRCDARVSDITRSSPAIPRRSISGD